MSDQTTKSEIILKAWLAKHPEITKDRVKPILDQLVERLRIWGDKLSLANLEKAYADTNPTKQLQKLLGV